MHLQPGQPYPSHEPYGRPGIKPSSQVAQHIWGAWQYPEATKPEKDFQRPRQDIKNKDISGFWTTNKGYPGKALHFVNEDVRTADGKSSTRRRNKKMKEKVCRKDFTSAEKVGKQRDEYPFYSTREGAVQGYENTFKDTPASWNFSILPVETDHNKNAGNQTWFLMATRSG
ncbi:hypothetical protein ACFYY8_15105 [Streptosporangium sp. NPDC001559]|uniref:NucA/NucB deoxyribonuclease domain-containing protein n=1 Tax=Streptosporangium sp. NPDC001559 TaxID=3366187 RepID=UPI0036ED7D54